MEVAVSADRNSSELNYLSARPMILELKKNFSFYVISSALSIKLLSVLKLGCVQIFSKKFYTVKIFIFSMTFSRQSFLFLECL